MGRPRAMLIQGGIDAKEEKDFWSEVISKASNLDTIRVRLDRTKTPFTLFYNKDAKYMKHLISFGEMTVVAFLNGKNEIQVGQQREKMSVCWIYR